MLGAELPGGVLVVRGSGVVGLGTHQTGKLEKAGLGGLGGCVCGVR